MSAAQTSTMTAMINQLPKGQCLSSTKPCQAGNRISRPISKRQATLDQSSLVRGYVSTSQVATPHHKTDAPSTQGASSGMR
ncbi:hypothetical protein D9M73_266340 [compost metagenome]